jgi:hypothetical protein
VVQFAAEEKEPLINAAFGPQISANQRFILLVKVAQAKCTITLRRQSKAVDLPTYSTQTIPAMARYFFSLRP